MRCIGLSCTLAVLLAGCDPVAPVTTTPDGGDTDPGGTDPGGTDPGADPTPVPMTQFGECSATVGCAAGLQCVEWGYAGRTYCMLPCSVNADCTGGVCTEGYCTRAAKAYEVCATLFESCEPDTYCYGSSPYAPWRCVPRCDTASPEAEQCPTPLPAGMRAEPPKCMAIAGLTVELCVAEVYAGERCDQAGLRCNLGGWRTDTDPQGPAQVGYPDPGALACLPAPDGGARCLRYCSVDDGATTSPCACPTADDPLCVDPPAGLAWQCHDWSALAPRLPVWACAPVEDCTLDPGVCVDDGEWGMTSCEPTPFTDPSPVSVCQ